MCQISVKKNGKKNFKMNQSKPSDADKQIINIVLGNLSVLLSSFISQFISSFQNQNNPDVISPEFLNLLSHFTSFDSHIESFIEKCVSLLSINFKQYFPEFLSYLLQVDIEKTTKFAPKALPSSHYLSRLDSEYKDSSLQARCIAYFFIDKLYSIIILKLLKKIIHNGNVEKTELQILFIDFLSVVNSIKNENLIKLKLLNINNWAEIIHILSEVHPIESYFIFVECLTESSKSDNELILGYSLYRSFSTLHLRKTDRDSFYTFESFKHYIKELFVKVPQISDLYISGALFLMNFVSTEIEASKQENSPCPEIIKYILELVTNSINYTPVSLPIAVIFFKHKNFLECKFTINQFFSNAFQFLSYVSGSAPLILQSFAQIFTNQHSYFDTYINQLHFKNNLNIEFDSITDDKIQKVFQRITSYGSFTRASNELIYLFVELASLNFPIFVQKYLKDFQIPTFLKFNSISIFEFFRVILTDDSIMNDFEKEFKEFKDFIKTLFHSFINSGVSKTDSVIYEIPFNSNIRIDHLFNDLEPQSYPPLNVGPNVKNDISLWSKMLCGKRIKLFEEEKRFSKLKQPELTKENQPLAFFISLIPFFIEHSQNNEIEEYDNILKKITSFIFSSSPQVSSISLYIIQYSIFNICNISIINDIILVLSKEPILSYESFFNMLNAIYIIISTGKNKNEGEIDGTLKDEIIQVIKQILVIALSSDICEIRNIAFLIIDLLPSISKEFKYDRICFNKFMKKLKILHSSYNMKVNLSEIPYRSFREIALTNNEMLYSIYLTIFFENSSIEIRNFSIIERNLTSLFSLNLMNWYVNLLSFMIIKSNIIQANKIIEVFKLISDKTLLCNFASSISDLILITSYFENDLSSLADVSLILWERIHNEDTIGTFLKVIIDITKALPDGFFKESAYYQKTRRNTNNKVEQIKFDNQTISKFLKLLVKILSCFAKSHEKLTSGPFLRRFLSEDAFIFFKYENDKDELFLFCINAAISDDLSRYGKKSLEAICKVSSFFEAPLRYFDFLKRFPQALSSIVSQSPIFFEYIIDQVKHDSFSMTLLSSIFSNISSISEGVKILAKKEKIYPTEPFDIEFACTLYSNIGQILAVCLWNFPSEDSLIVLRNIILSISFIKRNSLGEEINDLIYLFDDNQDIPLNFTVEKVSQLLSNSFEFCLDQFLMQSFDLLQANYNTSFVKILPPWLNKVHLSFSSPSLSKNTENCFQCLPSIIFIEQFCKIGLYELLDSLLDINVEPIFILGIHSKQSKLICETLRLIPSTIQWVCMFFDASFWRYQVCQLGKLDIKYYNEISSTLLDLLKSNEDNEYESNNFYIFTNFLLQEVVNCLYPYQTFQQLIPYIYTFCIAFNHENFVKEFIQKNHINIENLNLESGLLRNMFQCLFNWSIKCGNLSAALSSIEYLISHFDDNFYNKLNILPKYINDILETLTILVISINESNNSKKSRITGDTEFKVAPYYKYISKLIQLLTTLNLHYFDQQSLQQKDKSFLNLTSKVFWAIFEFLDAADKDFVTVFSVTINSLYSHIIKGIPNEDSHIKLFEGMFWKIIKNDPIISQNNLPRVMDQIYSIFTYLFKNRLHKTLIGSDLCSNEKNNIAISALICLPFSRCLQNKDFANNPIYQSIISSGLFNTDGSIMQLVDLLCDSIQDKAYPKLFQFYFFLAKFSPSTLYQVLLLSSILLEKCIQKNYIEVLQNDYLIRLINLALKDKSESNSLIICSFIESYKKICQFKNVSIPPHNSKFPVLKLSFNLSKYGEAADLYFPVEVSFLSLDFIIKIREKCSNFKIEPFTKWDDKSFKAELFRVSSTTSHVDPSIFKLTIDDIDTFSQNINNMKISKNDNSISQKVQASSEIDKTDNNKDDDDFDDETLFFISSDYFVPDPNEIDSLGPESFPSVFPKNC